MKDKIDGWVNQDKKWVPLQVKYRDSGDEIAMETMWGWEENRFSEKPLRFDGRDMVGGAKLYACLNQSGTVIRVCSADEAKRVAQESCNKLAHEFLTTGRRVASTSKAESRITGDPASGRVKIMSFVKPTSLQSIQLIPVPDGASLWAA